MNSAATELDVDSLMATIKAAAEKRNLRAHVNFEDFVLPGHDRPDENITPELKLVPEFELRTDDHYHINDFLQFHDIDFVRSVYRAILKREPDEKGLHHHLELLRSGRFNKIDILAAVRYSNEGELSGVTVDDLRLPSLIRSSERIPYLGYLFQLVIGVLRLPAMIRNHRQFESFVLTQQMAIAHHVNQREVKTTASLQQHELALERVESLPEAVQNFEAKFTPLMNLPSTVLSQVNETNEQIRETQNKASLLSSRVEQLSQVLQQTRVELNELNDNLGQWEHTPSAPVPPLSTKELLEWESLYASFENEFRGTPEEVKDRFEFYLPIVKDLGTDVTVVDLGCGRGDWLDLMKTHGINAKGIEANRVFVEECSTRGLDVVNNGIMEFLRDVPDESIDIITAFHLIEHLHHVTLIRLIDQIKRTLTPGGLVIFETPSPENLVSAACNFYSDPTHNRPIYPQTLMFILRNKDFVNLQLKFLHEVGESPFQSNEPGFGQLHNWFFGPRDFTVIGNKANLPRDGETTTVS